MVPRARDLLSVVALAATLVFGFPACGDDDDSQRAGEETITTTTEATAPADRSGDDQAIEEVHFQTVLDAYLQGFEDF